MIFHFVNAVNPARLEKDMERKQSLDFSLKTKAFLLKRSVI